MIGKLLKKIFSNGNEKVKEISRLDGMSSIKESVVCEECGHSIPLKKGGTFDKCPPMSGKLSVLSNHVWMGQAERS